MKPCLVVLKSSDKHVVSWEAVKPYGLTHPHGASRTCLDPLAVERHEVRDDMLSTDCRGYQLEWEGRLLRRYHDSVSRH